MEKTKKIRQDIITYLIAFVMLFIFIYPLYFVLVSSFKANDEIFASPFSLPKFISFANYATAFKEGNVGRQFLNSLILSIATLVLTIIVATMISFVIARMEFNLKELTRNYFLVGLMIPIQATIIPLSYMVGKFGLRNNYFVLILIYTASHLPLATFVITGFMKSLPSSLEEAAVVDGCNVYRVFFRIIAPLVKPAVATVSIFVFMYTWNDLLTAMVFIGKPELATVPVGLMNFTGARRSDYGALMAAIFVAILPPLFMYFAMQENIEKGLTSGAVK